MLHRKARGTSKVGVLSIYVWSRVYEMQQLKLFKERVVPLMDNQIKS
jgi:hypothetical protein